MFLNKKKNHSKYAIIFDITSGSVGAAFITHDHNTPTSPTILHTVRTTIDFDESKDANIVSALMESIKIAATQIIQATTKAKHGGNFDIHALLHAPWAVSTSETNYKNLKEPIKITQSIIQSFVKSAFPTLYEDGANNFNAHVTQFALNGYRIKKPIGKTAKQLEASLIISTMNPIVKKAIEDAIFSVFQGRDTIEFNTVQYASTLMAKNDIIDEYIIADITEEYASITTVRNNTIKNSVEIEFGSAYIIRAIAEKQKISYQSAKSLLTMFFKNATTPVESRKIKSALKTIEEEWVINLGDAFSKLSEHTRIPQTIFLNSTDITKQWFIDTLTRIDFAQFTNTTLPPQMYTIIDTEAHDLHFKDKKVIRDEQLLIASLFVDKYSLSNVHEDLFVL